MLRAVLTKVAGKSQSFWYPGLTRASLGVTSLKWNSPAASCMRQYSVYKDVWGNTVDYAGFPAKRNEMMNTFLNSPKRVQAISKREDRSDMPIEAVKAQCMGKYFIEHRGCQMLKTADDLIIFQQVYVQLQSLRLEPSLVALLYGWATCFV